MTSERSTVMIVAPSALERTVLTDRFFAAGYKVAEADSMEEALRKVVRVRPRAIVADQQVLSPDALATAKRMPTLLRVQFFPLLHHMSPALVRAYLEGGGFIRRAKRTSVFCTIGY
jgi:CheY-like chemotaxis protein